MDVHYPSLSCEQVSAVKKAGIYSYLRIWDTMRKRAGQAVQKITPNVLDI